MEKNQKSSIGIIIIVIVIVMVSVFVYSQNKSSIWTESNMRISLIHAASTNNSPVAFSTPKKATIEDTDNEFMGKYFEVYSSKNLPPIDQSQKILSKYSEMLAAFDDNFDKSFECYVLGSPCPLTNAHHAMALGGLRALVSFQENKIDEAQTQAENITMFGKNITAGADEIMNLLVGWSVQKLGYDIQSTIHEKTKVSKISDDQKKKLISNLRTEQKNVLRYIYTTFVEAVDYTDSKEKKPSIQISVDDEKGIAEYRAAIKAMPSSWNAVETKKYFSDSFSIALSNVDLACGDKPKVSQKNLNFNPQDQKAENFLGKTLYSTVYSSFDGMSEKRCEVESLIKGL